MLDKYFIVNGTFVEYLGEMRRSYSCACWHLERDWVLEDSDREKLNLGNERFQRLSMHALKFCVAKQMRLLELSSVC